MLLRSLIKLKVSLIKVRRHRSRPPRGELDYTRLLSRALRAIRYANVRSGILPPQSGFRLNDEPGDTIPTQLEDWCDLAAAGNTKR
jgi:hypothetical protein